MNAIRITQIEAIPVRVPVKSNLAITATGGHHALCPYVLVRIHTDAGLTGLGEATITPRWSGETNRGCVAAIEGLIAPELLGEDPTNVTSLRLRMDRVLRLNPFTKAAVEMALWDLAGKAAGLPLYRLLGGKVRPEVAVKWVIGACDPAEAAARARSILGKGAACLKVKVGLDPVVDVQRVRAVREAAGPKVPIGIDANQGWDLPTARKALAQLEELDLLFAEQPIPAGDPAAWVDLRCSTCIPLMADESVSTPQDAAELISHRAVDILSVYPGKHGGIGPTLEIAHAASAAGLVCTMGSNLELGVAAAAMLHLGVAVPAIDTARYPGDFIGPFYVEDDLLTERLPLTPTSGRPPEGPGLGVTLSDEALDRYRDSGRLAAAMS